MPSKRSKSQEREKKRKYREKLSAEGLELAKEKARKGMAFMRNSLSDVEKEKRKKKENEAKKKRRKNLNNMKRICQNAKEKKDEEARKLRAGLTDEEKEKENEKKQIRMRTLRKKRKQLNIEPANSNMDGTVDLMTKLNEDYRKEKEIVFKKKKKTEQEYLKKMKRIRKRKEIAEKLKTPIPPLPIRELSEYEKIREAIINHRKREWKIYEKEWEKKWEENHGRKYDND